MYLVNSQEMKQCDNNTIAYYGLPSMVLMERAALSVFAEVTKRTPNKESSILVLCGCGNNGGDGFAAARLLHLAGYHVEVFCPGNKEKMTAETKNQYDTAAKYHVPETDELSEGAYDIVIDALFGIGLSRPIEGALSELLQKSNRMNAFKIAVDIASGIAADTGEILGTAFCADLTVTFGFAKVGQLLYPGAEYTGELVVADIGIDAHSFLDQKPFGNYLTKTDAAKFLPERRDYSNKGSYGKVLIVAGSPNMAGAAYFAAKAAYLSGCGLVRIFTAKENREILLTKLPEAIVTTYDSEVVSLLPKGFKGYPQDLSPLEECIQWADAVLIGPGLGCSTTAEQITEEVLQYKEKKIVFDADALNILSNRPQMPADMTENHIITPHLGEMSRLLNCSIGQIKQNLLQTAVDFAGKYHLICVLKDARTIIGAPDGSFYINTTGNHGMATGGSGDVLAGFMTGFMAQGLTAYDAAVLSAYLHGKAGDFASSKKSAYSMLASDLLDEIPTAIKEIIGEI